MYTFFKCNTLSVFTISKSLHVFSLCPVYNTIISGSLFVPFDSRQPLINIISVIDFVVFYSVV